MCLGAIQNQERTIFQPSDFCFSEVSLIEGAEMIEPCPNFSKLC